MPFDYYTAPAGEIFADIKRSSMKLWDTYDDAYGYRSEKINRIKDLDNVKDNAWTMVAMFDTNNQHKLLKMVKPETAEEIKKAIKG